jgi:hypothetical protein
MQTGISLGVFISCAETLTRLLLLLLLFMALQPSAGYGIVTQGSLITHNNAPQSVRLLWTSDQLVAESST